MTQSAGESVLKKLQESRVLTFEQGGNTFIFTEGCDNYFSLALSAEELLGLGWHFVNLGEDARMVL